MNTLLQDLRYALRQLRRNPGFTAVAVLTLGLGIGATTTMFGLINALLLRPLPVPEPERLVSVAEQREGRTRTVLGYPAIPYPRYEAYREASRGVLSGLAGQSYAMFALRENDEAKVVSGGVVTDNFFQVLGLRPALGRLFSTVEDADGTPVAVISHELWQRELAGDPDAIGRTLHLDSRAYTLVGVTPRGFAGTALGLAQEAWVPVAAWRRMRPEDREAREAWLVPFARLKSGVSEEQARAALEVIAKRIPPEDPQTTIRGMRVEELSGVPPFARGPIIGFLGMLLATGGLVLLIASTNVAGMLLARAAARRRETAIRLAIGAGRGRLVRQLLTESLVLFLLGGGVGVLLTYWAAELVAAFHPPVPIKIALDLTPDARVLGFALLLALVTGGAFGLAPALQASRPELVPALKSGDGAQGVGRTRLRSAFVVAQLAMSLLLLIGAGLFVRTLQNALRVDPGFEPDGVVVASIDLRAHGYDTERTEAFFATLLERLRATPGTESAALAGFPPMSGYEQSSTAELPDRQNGNRAADLSLSYNTVDPGYFSTLRIPLVAGRELSAADRDGAPRVAVVNQTLAARFWPAESPLGKQFRLDGETYEVVGVARDSRTESVREESGPFAYFPFAQRVQPRMTVFLRARGEPGQALTLLRQETRTLDPNVALEEATPLPALIGLSLFPQRAAASLIGGFGLLGLVLAAVGLYGILAFHVTSRTREIGIRMALGAHSADVVRLVVRNALALVTGGVLLGLVASLAATRLLGSLLYGVSATDPLTFTAVPLLLAGAALLASYVPARRATRVDPMVALRSE